jgi:site-specific DNA-methyltransferase (adenine-specific)
VGNAEYALLLYREKLPKYRNMGKMIFNCLEYVRDNETPRIHPTQKSIHLISHLIRIFTEPGDVVIDPCAGSGVTLLAAENLNRKAYGFEIKKEYCRAFEKDMRPLVQTELFEEPISKRQERIPELGERA